MKSPSQLPKMCMASTFGVKEFEDLAKDILAFLKSDRRSDYWLIGKGCGYEDGNGWKKRFTINDIPSLKESPSMFAAFCCGGWLDHVWFPKGAFIVSDAFIDRVTSDTCSTCKGNRATFDKCTAGNKLDHQWFTA